MKFSKIVGVTFQNEDGSNRQKLIEGLKPNQPLQLIRDPENKHDANAVKVVTFEGAQLGFLSKAEAKYLAPKLDNGATSYAFVSEVTGGGSYSFGCNIRFDVVEAS